MQQASRLPAKGNRMKKLKPKIPLHSAYTQLRCYSALTMCINCNTSQNKNHTKESFIYPGIASRYANVMVNRVSASPYD